MRSSFRRCALPDGAHYGLSASKTGSARLITDIRDDEFSEPICASVCLSPVTLASAIFRPGFASPILAPSPHDRCERGGSQFYRGPRTGVPGLVTLWTPVHELEPAATIQGAKLLHVPPLRYVTMREPRPPRRRSEGYLSVSLMPLTALESPRAMDVARMTPPASPDLGGNVSWPRGNLVLCYDGSQEQSFRPKDTNRRPSPSAGCPRTDVGSRRDLRESCTDKKEAP